MSATRTWFAEGWSGVGGVLTARLFKLQAANAATGISTPQRAIDNLPGFPRQVGVDERHEPIRRDRPAHAALVEVFGRLRGDDFLLGLAGLDRRGDSIAN